VSHGIDGTRSYPETSPSNQLLKNESSEQQQPKMKVAPRTPSRTHKHMSNSDLSSFTMADSTLEKMAQTVVDRRLETPVLFLLEMNRPFSFFAGQALLFAEPLAGAFFGFRRIRAWQQLFENRKNVDRLIELIEAKSMARSEGKDTSQVVT